MARLTDSVIEDAALAWLERLFQVVKYNIPFRFLSCYAI
jgi:hypothetical protein